MARDRFDHECEYEQFPHEVRVERMLINILLKLEAMELKLMSLNDDVTALQAAVQASSDAQTAADTETSNALAQIQIAISNGDTAAASATIQSLTKTIAANTARQQADTEALVNGLASISVPAPAPAPTPAPTPAPAPAPAPAAAPVASFSNVADANVAMQYDFTDTSVDANGITGWAWDFGDGVGKSTEQNPTYLYTTPGVYNVVLTITDPTGSYASAPVNLVVSAAAPAPAPTSGN